MEQLRDRLTQVDIDGEAAFVLAEHADALATTSAAKVVRLLPAFDQWVFGPGTADRHITPPARRAVVTRGSNFVIFGGVVSGTWTLKKDEVSLDWFDEAGPKPRDALVEEIERLAGVLGRPLTAHV
jgi:hypothetical protein